MPPSETTTSGKRIAGLNPAQSEAALHVNGPLLVLAGAGSGKTRVITHRIANLVKVEGVRPEAILAVSFTNKSAEEMAERMVPLVGAEHAKKLWLSTFHSFGVRFLQEESAKLLGEERGRAKFSIFDQGDCLGLVREIVKREGIGDRKMDLYAVHSRISLWKNKGLSASEVRANTEIEYDKVANDVYPHYESALKAMRAFDFDDLVVAPVRALRESAELREKWSNRFRFLLVDEFQDTNAIQLEMVKLLANAQKNVCVVGDDDQSIYGWRGADVGNILDFERIFSGAKIVKLETNYRSKEPILEVANAAIARSSGKRHEKVLRAHQKGGDKVRLCTFGDPDQEAKFAAKEIRGLRSESRRFGDVAILYRSNLQARAFEEELRVEGIPYRVAGGTQFFEKKEVKDAIAYLRVVANPRDELSLRRILNYPARGIGDVTIERMERFAKARRAAFATIALDPKYVPDIPEAAKDGAERLSNAIEKARDRVDKPGLVAMALELFDDVGFRRDLEDSGGDAEKKKRWDNVQFVMRSLDRYEKMPSNERASLATFLSRLTIRREEEGEEAGDEVTLSSLHSSKGLEWPVVFLVGLNEGTLPHGRTIDPKVSEAAPTDVEEERRLFYVGVTRARERLYLTRFLRRELRGAAKPTVISRFLEGLPEEQVEVYERDDDAPASREDSMAMAAAFLAKLKGG
jgi:ATP-dependent DNA helicase Rep